MKEETRKLCPHCRRSNYIKFGKQRKIQRYKCQECERTFTVQKVGKALDNYYKVKVIQMYLEGFPIYKISDIIGIHEKTISKYIPEEEGIRNYLDEIRLPIKKEFKKVKYDSDIARSRLEERTTVGIILIGDKNKGVNVKKESVILLNKR